jgi:hypothetical protein
MVTTNRETRPIHVVKGKTWDSNLTVGFKVVCISKITKKSAEYNKKNIIG